MDSSACGRSGESLFDHQSQAQEIKAMLAFASEAAGQLERLTADDCSS
jgi:hypothetical protein